MLAEMGSRVKRLLLAPVVICPVVVAAYWSGLLWPVMTTAWSIVAPRPLNEPEIIA